MFFKSFDITSELVLKQLNGFIEFLFVDSSYWIHFFKAKFLILGLKVC